MFITMGEDGLPRDAEGNVPEWAQKRNAYVNGYCDGKDWDRSNLSITQFLEIIKQPGWKEAGEQ